MKKILIFGIILVIIIMSIAPKTWVVKGYNNLIDYKTKATSDDSIQINNDTEYWALLIYMGIYADGPDLCFVKWAKI